MISVANAAAEVHAKPEGMPQFEPSMFEHQIFWSVISFLILLYLLNKHVMPAIKELLDVRAKKIEDDLASAQKARREAEKIQADLNNKLISSHKVASDVCEQARVEASLLRERAVEELSLELEKKKKAAVEDIEIAKKKALAEVQAVVVDVAVMATEKLIAKNVTKESASAMVDEALNEIKDSKTSLH
ncbi:MAG: F0F1 ATP synthase subunit B [Magnetococcales bacterium]|nr:F0F1 ATP synthase subunit B [Magnetococcales bacterium]